MTVITVLVVNNDNPGLVMWCNIGHKQSLNNESHVIGDCHSSAIKFLETESEIY